MNLAENIEPKKEVNYVASNTEFTHQLKPEDKVKKANTAFLYFTVLTVQLLSVVNGANLVWTSPVIPKLSSNDTDVNPLGKPITTHEISMISGVPVFLSLLGSLVLPIFADLLGRKRFLQAIGFGSVCSFTLLAFSTSATMMLVLRCIAFLFVSGFYAVLPIYTTEVCEDHNRAKFGCFVGLFHQIGHFYGFVVGPVVSFKMFTFLVGAPAVLFLLLSYFIPDTPNCLLFKKKEEECIRAMKKLRSNKNTSEITRDLDILKQSLHAKHSSQYKPNIISFFKTKETRTALFLALLPVSAQHLSGVSVIMSFLAPFFNSAGTGFSGNNLGMIVGVLKIFCFTIASFVVEKFGRKRMLLISTVGTGLPLFVMGSFLFLKHMESPIIDKILWLPIPLVLLNVVMYSLGLGPIPMAIIHELFPPEYRTIAGSITATVISLIVFALTYSFPIVGATIGIHWAMWLFGVCCAIYSFLISKFLPDTKGMSLKEIQDILKSY